MAKEMKELPNDIIQKIAKDKSVCDQYVLIDIREPSEYRNEHIAGSKNVPLNQIAKTDFSKDIDKIAIFFCRLGHRTKSACNTILNTGFSDIYCLSGGIEQWKQLGCPTVVDKHAPIDIMRQVQIVVGTLILASLLLTSYVSPAFIWLTAFFGAALTFAGLTGFCGMATLLSYMPWNKLK